MTTFTVITRKQLYWICQLGGWMSFIAIEGLSVFLKGKFTATYAFSLVFIFLFGITLTQVLRWIIIRFNWLKLSIPTLAPLVLISNLVMALIMSFIQSGFDQVTSNTITSKSVWTQYIANFTFFFLFWSVIYFLVHFLESFKNAEIQKFKWKAAIQETELNKLKSQLNPHFMFNAMNSIRALVGEDPAKAKEAITQFSNLLRTTLQIGKQKLIPFSQELEAVKDYLAIEGIRLEERLQVEWKIDPLTETMEVPPLMIQTLVENGIKHGIAKLPEGGKLSVESKKSGEDLEIVIRNSGQYDEAKIPETGYGMQNTFQRLNLLYGGKAKFHVTNENSNTVITTLSIPSKADEPI